MTARSGRSGHGQLYPDSGSSLSGLGRGVLICGGAIVGFFLLARGIEFAISLCAVFFCSRHQRFWAVEFAQARAPSEDWGAESSNAVGPLLGLNLLFVGVSKCEFQMRSLLFCKGFRRPMAQGFFPECGVFCQSVGRSVVQLREAAAGVTGAWNIASARS